MTEPVPLDRTRNRVGRCLVVLAGVALLSGCGATSPAPPVTTVTVSPDGTTATPAPTDAPTSPAAPSSVPTVDEPGRCTGPGAGRTNPRQKTG